MDTDNLIEDLYRMNERYGRLSDDAYSKGHIQEAMRLGSMADDAGEAAEMLEDGATVERVNSRYSGICDF